MSETLYIQRIPTDVEKKVMHDMIDSGKFEKLREFINECYKRIELCEIDFGWKVIFKIYNKYYEPTRQSIIDFCKKNHYIVVGKEKQLTIEEAFEYFDEHNANSKNKYTYEKYFTDHPEMTYSFIMDYFSSNYWKTHGYDVKYNAFENDGLYFLISKN